MVKTNVVLVVAYFMLVITACKKSEVNTIINNYESQNTPPKRRLLTEYGLADSAQVLKLTYLNDEVGKLQTLTSFSSGVAKSKFVVLYNSANKAEGYQTYTLPANTLDEQGTYKMDSKGRIIMTIKRKPNGDTIGIVRAYYNDLDYQPTSTNYYDKTKNRITNYDYMTYDNRGNITRTVSYINNGSDPLYKSSEVEAYGFGKAINPLNQFYYYLLTSFSSGYGSSGPLYFSNYFATSTMEQKYKANGSNDNVNLTDYILEMDEENNLTLITSGGTSIYMKYKK